MKFLFIWLLGDIANLSGSNPSPYPPRPPPSWLTPSSLRRPLDEARTDNRRPRHLLLLRRPHPHHPMLLLQRPQRPPAVAQHAPPPPLVNRHARHRHHGRLGRRTRGGTPPPPHQPSPPQRVPGPPRLAPAALGPAQREQPRPADAHHHGRGRHARQQPVAAQHA